MELKGQATAAQIAEWKAKHSDVYSVTVDGHICYLKSPDRKVLGYASVAGKTNPLAFNEALLRGCWLGGSEEIKTNDDLFLGASGVLADIITAKEASLGKL